MPTTSHVTMGAWAQVGADCPIDRTVSDGAAELIFGGSSEPLSLLVTERALEKLIPTAAKALQDGSRHDS